MKLIIISGRSGSGKSTCLNALEDLGYYCVDNLPASLLEGLAKRINSEISIELNNVAVSIDARNIANDLQQFPVIYQNLSNSDIDAQIIFLDADDSTLLQRYSETRRKHPLSNKLLSLVEAINKEKVLLEPISALAHLSVDTSELSLHQLRDLVKNRVAEHNNQGISLQFLSFGFKNGLPIDADMVFDVRCLPNPYWDTRLRELTGQDVDVIEYLESQPEVTAMYDDIKRYLESWLPKFEANNRSYITVAIGCTGGQHRSVFLVEKLLQHFSKSITNVQLRHKEFA